MNVLIVATLLGLIPAQIMASIAPADHKRQAFIEWWLFGALLFIVALPMALIKYNEHKART